MTPSSPFEPTDEALVAHVLEGDIQAFDQLLLKYKEKLYGVIYNMTSNHEDTNDLLMEVFDKAFRSLASFKGESSFYTWLYRIAMNRAINHLHKNKKNRNNLSLNEIDEDEGHARELFDSSAIANPSQQVDLKELQKKLNESLQKLSEEHRAVVVLFDIEGLSHADISRVLNCSEGTVRSRLHYAHKQLQKLLEPFLRKSR